MGLDVVKAAHDTISRADKIKDRLCEDAELRFDEKHRENGAVELYVYDRDDNFLGMILVPEHHASLCEYYFRPGVGIKIVNLTIQEAPNRSE